MIEWESDLVRICWIKFNQYFSYTLNNISGKFKWGTYFLIEMVIFFETWLFSIWEVTMFFYEMFLLVNKTWMELSEEHFLQKLKFDNQTSDLIKENMFIWFLQEKPNKWIKFDSVDELNTKVRHCSCLLVKLF